MVIKKISSLLAIPNSNAKENYKVVTRPWDGEVIAEVQASDWKDAEQAIGVAYEIYQNRSQWLTPAKRIEIIEKVCEILKERSDQIALQSATEGGKPLIDSQVEMARAIITLQSCVDYLRSGHAHGSRIPMQITASSLNRVAYTVKEPIGVVLAFSAFNHPINLIAHQVGSAIAAGCPIIVKPAENTPLSCFELVNIFHEAGLPQAYCQAMLTDSHETSHLCVSDLRVGFFSFIGSGKVGWSLRSKLAPGARCTLEHGGSAPVIIAQDADLKDNLPLIAKGAFYHAGQVCVSVQRVFVHQSILKQVVDELVKLAGALKIGDPTLPDTEVGPLIRPQEVDRVEKWVNEAIESGAELSCGGQRVSERAYQCTVLVNPPPSAKVSCKEVFGPVVCVYSYTEMEDAIKRANIIPFSFQSSVITQNMDTALDCIKNLDAAAVMVNDHTAFRVDWMPFAGHKQSGYGTGGSSYSIEDMQAEKLVVIRSKYI